MESKNNKKLNDFFEDEYPSLKRYVRSKLSDSTRYDAEDIIQDVALKLFAGANRYSPINNVASFVYRAIKNRIIDLMRSSKKHTVSTESQKETKLNELLELLYGTADNSYSETLKLDFKNAIMQLTPDYRNVILARDFEDYTYK